MKIVGIILIVLGALALACGGSSYTREEENLDAVVAFARAIKRGDYDLGFALEAPGQVPGTPAP